MSNFELLCFPGQSHGHHAAGELPCSVGWGDQMHAQPKMVSAYSGRNGMNPHCTHRSISVGNFGKEKSNLQ
jgi:hypothetical protein